MAKTQKATKKRQGGIWLILKWDEDRGAWIDAASGEVTSTRDAIAAIRQTGVEGQYRVLQVKAELYLEIETKKVAKVSLGALVGTVPGAASDVPHEEDLEA